MLQEVTRPAPHMEAAMQVTLVVAQIMAVAAPPTMAVEKVKPNAL